MDNYNYPIGADTPNAPWNQVNQPKKKVKVTLSITINKTVELAVDDYKVEEDEYSGYPVYDFSDCDIQKAIEEQVTLPDLEGWIPEYVDYFIK